MGTRQLCIPHLAQQWMCPKALALLQCPLQTQDIKSHILVFHINCRCVNNLRFTGPRSYKGKQEDKLILVKASKIIGHERKQGNPN